MKGDKQVIAHLNDALKKELTAVSQYFLHARMLDDWGITKLAKHEYDESIEEMKHADRFIQRILLLGGLPNLQELNKLYIGEDVKEVLECDLKGELESQGAYRTAITHCESVHDYVSRDLFAEILADEENHIDHIETQLDMIKKMGIEDYIQLQSSPITEQEG